MDAKNYTTSESESASTCASENEVVQSALKHLSQFYKQHPELSQSASHGLDHALAVHQHASRAIQSLRHDGVPRSYTTSTTTSTTFSFDGNNRNGNGNDGTNRSTRSGENVIISLSEKVANEIQLAALLHDVDDYKYSHCGGNGHGHGNANSARSEIGNDQNEATFTYKYPNARKILSAVLKECKEQHTDRNIHRNMMENPSSSSSISLVDVDRILYMIDLVSCSQNGNDIPNEIRNGSSSSGDDENNASEGCCRGRHSEQQYDYQYHWLIPRWSDRLEAVGRQGVIRCYQYTLEKGRPLWDDGDPRPKSETEVWDHVTPKRFRQYLTRGKRKDGGNGGNDFGANACHKDTMIAHYYDKLLHIARPPPDIVRNVYLEQAGRDGSSELVEVCVRFGLTGRVDENYIRHFMTGEGE